MKRFLNLLLPLVLAAVIGFPMSSHAGSPRDLSNGKSIMEFPLITPTPNAAAGDYTIRWQGAQRRFIRVDASLVGTSRSGAGTVVSGQTSVAITVNGVTAASRCQATQQNVATNSVYLRAAAPTANTVTVTLSGDPGASGQNVAVYCLN